MPTLKKNEFHHSQAKILTVLKFKFVRKVELEFHCVLVLGKWSLLSQILSLEGQLELLVKTSSFIKARRTIFSWVVYRWVTLNISFVGPILFVTKLHTHLLDARPVPSVWMSINLVLKVCGSYLRLW